MAGDGVANGQGWQGWQCPTGSLAPSGPLAVDRGPWGSSSSFWCLMPPEAPDGDRQGCLLTSWGHSFPGSAPTSNTRTCVRSAPTAGFAQSRDPMACIDGIGSRDREQKVGTVGPRDASDCTRRTTQYALLGEDDSGHPPGHALTAEYDQRGDRRWQYQAAVVGSDRCVCILQGWSWRAPDRRQFVW